MPFIGTTLEEIADRVARLERLDTQFLAVTQAITTLTAILERHRDDVLALRDAHGQCFADIEQRLGAIERELSETEGWLARRFDDIDGALADIAGRLP